MKRSNEIVQPCAQQINAMLPHYMTIYSPPCDVKKKNVIGMCESFVGCATSKEKEVSLWLVLLHMHNLMCISMFERKMGVSIGVMLASLFGMNNYNCKI